MDCIFCKIINNEIPSYTIYEDENVKCFLDINPVSKGHTLIVPKKHIKDFYDIDNETLLNVLDASKKITNLINEKLKPNGIRLVQNNGILQDVKHFHLHIIPSYTKEEKNNNVEEVFQLLTK